MPERGTRLISKILLEVFRTPTASIDDLADRCSDYRGAARTSLSRRISELQREQYIGAPKSRFYTPLERIIEEGLLVRAYVGIILNGSRTVDGHPNYSDERELLRYLRNTEKDFEIYVQSADLIFSGTGQWDVLVCVMAIDLRTLRDWVLRVGEEVGETHTMIVAASGSRGTAVRELDEPQVVVSSGNKPRKVNVRHTPDRDTLHGD